MVLLQQGLERGGDQVFWVLWVLWQCVPLVEWLPPILRGFRRWFRPVVVAVVCQVDRWAFEAASALQVPPVCACLQACLGGWGLLGGCCYPVLRSQRRIDHAEWACPLIRGCCRQNEAVLVWFYLALWARRVAGAC